MGSDYYYCPHCSKAIPLDDIRKKLDQQYNLRIKQIKEREDQLAKEHSKWEQQFKSFMDTKILRNIMILLYVLNHCLELNQDGKLKVVKEENNYMKK